ncbi:MAG TPA: sensor domain-containing diguanylate cyclase [Xanthobacteraceae bacterium]|nr:sensor domain-containing diguanylate cyclase [Xanthobacteraceae bacterium]
MFEFSPVAMLISTTGPDTHRYVKANKAFLDLTGFSWDELAGQDMLERGPAVDSPARKRRLRLLQEHGGYRLEEVEIRHAGGALIPTLVSSQRSTIAGVSYDVDMLMDVSDRVAVQRARERDLAVAARTDGLTGLPNRLDFDLQLAERLAGAAAHTAVALAFIDLNGFKPINDRYGHSIGDMVLRELANRLRRSRRDSDFVARIGGDEFAIIFDLPKGETLSLDGMLRRIADSLFEPIVVGDGRTLTFGAAIGVAVHDKPGGNVDDLFRLADRQMYRAKATGERICIRIATKAGRSANAEDD